MKKTLITLLTLIFCTALNAQLKVVSNGNVAIGDTAIVPLSNLSIKDHGDPSYNCE